MSRREQLASEAGGELDPKLAGARDPHNAFLWHARLFSGILMECLNFNIGLRLFKWITENNNQHLVLKKALHM